MLRGVREYIEVHLPSHFKNFARSIWLFPVILLVPLIILTALRISGSSIGQLHTYLYGPTKDPKLIAGNPEAIRSDEWLVNTEMIVAQAKAGYPRVNPNIGNGEDVSLEANVPYKEWSVIFRPENLIFFILPLAYAFAFQWWLIGYLLIVSCYFFVLTLLPKKRLMASLLSISLFFSAFIQWWYLYATLAPLFYCLFIATAVICLSRQRVRWKKITLLGVISYLSVCFILILYPPFQIACGLALAAFLIGYFLESYPKWGRVQTLHLLLELAISVVVSVTILGVFILTRSNVVNTIANTSYPGHRTVPSGGFDFIHLMSSQLGYQFTYTPRASLYRMNNAPTNQSEASNFLLLIPFLVIPGLVLLYKDWRARRAIDKPLLAIVICFIIFMLHLFVSAFTPLQKLLLLDEVETSRVLIGVGLLNLMAIVIIMRKGLQKEDHEWPAKKFTVIYSLLVFLCELAINLHVHHTFGAFLGAYRALAFAIPLPLIIYLLLRKHFVIAIALYCAFSVFIGYKVNPLYQGLSTLTNNPLSIAIQNVGTRSNKRWTTDSINVENLSIVNGQRSLSGDYFYPQKSLWKVIPGASYTAYNRYAHVVFGFDKYPTAPPKLVLVQNDTFQVTAGICSSYLQKEDVGFVVTLQKLTGNCVAQTIPVKISSATFYIYKLHQ